jgi:hypothetical protein
MTLVPSFEVRGSPLLSRQMQPEHIDVVLKVAIEVQTADFDIAEP